MNGLPPSGPGWAGTKAGAGEKPRRMTEPMSPNEPNPRVTTVAFDIGQVVLLLLVGAVAELRVRVAAVVEPFSFLMVSVVLAIANSVSR